MPVKHSGLRGWWYRRTPQVLTALGYAIGLSVLAAAAATGIVETTIMVSGSGVAAPRVSWLSAEGPALVRHVDAPPGSRVRAGAPLVRLIDSPEQVRRAHYLRQLEEGLRAMAADAAPDAFPQQAAADLERAMQAQAAGISERVLVAPHDGWAVLPQDGEEPAPGEPVAAGVPLAGVASLDTVAVDISLNDTRAPTARTGDSVSLLVADWGTGDLLARVAGIRTWAVLELPRSAVEPERAHQWETATDTTVRIGDSPCPAQATLTRESIVLRASLDGLPPSQVRKLQSGRQYRVAVGETDAVPHRARLSTFETAITLRIPRDRLTEPMRRQLEQALEEGRTQQPIAQAWVGVRRTSLFARLFGK